jgi:hypothetical protein
MNKGSIAKYQNFKGQIENSHFSGENGTILNPLSIPFLFWDRGTPLQKKEKKCRLVRPHRLKPDQNINQIVYHLSPFCSSLPLSPQCAISVKETITINPAMAGLLVSQSQEDKL